MLSRLSKLSVCHWHTNTIVLFLHTPHPTPLPHVLMKRKVIYRCLRLRPIKGFLISNDTAVTLTQSWDFTSWFHLKMSPRLNQLWRTKHIVTPWPDISNGLDWSQTWPAYPIVNSGCRVARHYHPATSTPILVWRSSSVTRSYFSWRTCSLMFMYFNSQGQPKQGQAGMIMIYLAVAVQDAVCIALFFADLVRGCFLMKIPIHSTKWTYLRGRHGRPDIPW